MNILSKEEIRKLDDFIRGIRSVMKIDPCSCVNEVSDFLNSLTANALDDSAKDYLETSLTAESISNFILKVMKNESGLTQRRIFIDLYDDACALDSISSPFVEFHYHNAVSSVYKRDIVKRILRKWLAE